MPVPSASGLPNSRPGSSCACRFTRCSRRRTCWRVSPNSSTTWTGKDAARSGERHFPTPPPRPRPAASPNEFRELAERLRNRLVDRLQAEADPERRALIVGFPTQLASLEEALTDFVTEAYGGSNAGPAPLLRGVYLTSATQEGTPIDRLTGAIARAFGLSPQRTARLRPQEGRSYFLTHLLHDVVFNEAMLVSSGRRRGGALVRAAGLAAALLLVIAAGGALWREYTVGQRPIDAAANTLASYEQATTGLALDPVADADLASLTPLLDQAFAVLRGDTASGATAWWSVFSQDEKLAAGRRALYRHAIEHALFPRLIWRLEAQLRGNLNNPEFLYEGTRVYLMLGGDGPLDKDLVREWMALDWQVAYPGSAAAPLRASLSRHLDALLSGPLPAIALEGELVAAARGTFGRVTLAQRVYSRIRPSAAARSVPPWRPSDALGAAGGVVFVRASGRPLDDGVPGFYTIDGFHKVLLPTLGDAVRQVASESWVLGEALKLDPQSGQIRTLQHEVIVLYEADYAKHWDAMLADLNLVPLRSLVQAAQDLYIASSEHSPMRTLLASAARQLTLSGAPDVQGQRGTTPPAAGITDTGTRLQALLGAAPEIAAAPPGHEIDDRYQKLRDLVATDAGARLDRVMQTVAELQQQLAKLAAAGIRTGPPPAAGGNDPVITLRMEAQHQPQPVARWLTTMADGGMALRGGDARQQVITAYNAANGPAALCAAAVNGHYPFTPQSARDTTIDDFARLFAPGGVLDGFFNTLLKPYVDTTGPVWKPLSVDGAPSPIAAAEVAQFQRAAQIRDLFFPDGRATPTIRFDITPASLDSRAKQVTLDLDGTVITFTREMTHATEISWPDTKGTGLSRLSFTPPPASGADGWQETGDWAMFRLFGHGKLLAGTANDRLGLMFQLAERQTVFDIRTGARNPLASALLQSFHCPTIQ